MKSLRDNFTFTQTTLPEGKKAVGGRWVYAIKSDADRSAKYKTMSPKGIVRRWV